MICTTLTMCTSQLTGIMKHFVALCASGILRLCHSCGIQILGGGGGGGVVIKKA